MKGTCPAPLCPSFCSAQHRRSVAVGGIPAACCANKAFYFILDLPAPCCVKEVDSKSGVRHRSGASRVRPRRQPVSWQNEFVREGWPSTASLALASTNLQSEHCYTTMERASRQTSNIIREHQRWDYRLVDVIHKAIDLVPQAVPRESTRLIEITDAPFRFIHHSPHQQPCLRTTTAKNDHDSPPQPPHLAPAPHAERSSVDTTLCTSAYKAKRATCPLFLPLLIKPTHKQDTTLTHTHTKQNTRKR